MWVEPVANSAVCEGKLKTTIGYTSPASTMITVQQRHGLSLKTRMLSQAVASVKGHLAAYIPNCPLHERARQIIEVFVATMRDAYMLLNDLNFSGVFILKVIEVRSDKVFRQGLTNLPCPCWFDKLMCDILEVLQLNTLAHSSWPLTTSVLEYYYHMSFRRPHCTVVAMLDDLQAHIHASRVHLSHIRSLEERAADTVYDAEYHTPAMDIWDPWTVGSMCRATWGGDGHAHYRDAKIVSISRFRRTCRIVYSTWNGWGWGATQYTVLLKNLIHHASEYPGLCDACDEYDAILCDRYV